MDKETMERVCKEVISFYGSVKPWNDLALMAYQAKHFAGYLPDKVIKAVGSYAAEHPEKAPNPAQLLAFIRSGVEQVEGLIDPAKCNHPQPWAIVDERTRFDTDDNPPFKPLKLEHPVGTRVGYCRRCGTEFVRGPGSFLTDDERTDREKARSEYV